MRFNLIILWSVLLFLMIDPIYATSLMKKKKFESPAAKFVGTWQVDSYDFREFEEPPPNLAEQLKKEESAFPIGQRIRFVSTGSAIMPGTIDPVTMKSNGPIGDTLEMTILQPFEKSLCSSESFWKFACGSDLKDYPSELMISFMEWSERTKEKRKLWADINPMDFFFEHLGKLYGFQVWTAKNGDILFSTVVVGHRKGGGKAGRIGIRLKKIGN